MRSLSFIGAALLIGAALPAAADEPPDFDTTIAPLLASHCLDCHSGPEPKGKLDLSRSAAAQAGGESGPAVVPANLTESQLWQRVDAGEMPPKKPLPEKERGLLKAWIVAGAKWGADPIDPFRFSTATRAGYDWWSLQPLVHRAAPRFASPALARNSIDAFVLDRLSETKLSPSAEADRPTLIRRLSYDLIGLPPSPEEIDAFESDPSPDAYERLVDRMLASPQHGERWARHWLDVAHFGESDGFEFDRMRPHAWRYRDWVIEALNHDTPYDEFARQQLAGDVLQSGDARALAATGFLVAGPYDGLMPAGDAMRAMMRQDELEDLVGTVAQTFLGMTVHCARCHDHKFDPIPQRDYYRLSAALAGVKRGERPLPESDTPAWLAARRDELNRQVTAIEKRARETILARRVEQRKVIGKPPEPALRWTFDDGTKDDILGLELQLHGDARIEAGHLVLSGDSSFATSPPLAFELKAKTLEVWVQLADLKQRSGGVLTVESLSGDVFDSIVYGEKTPGHWIAGSEFFRRTQEFNGPAEDAADKRLVHLAIVYGEDGRITLYRDGLPHGSAYVSNGPNTFAADESRVSIGLRHSPAAAGKLLSGKIDSVRVYDRPLSADEVAASAGVENNVVTAEELAAELPPSAAREREQLQSRVAALSDQLDRWKQNKVFAVTPQPPPATHVLVRGNSQQKADEVTAGGLIALDRSAAEFGLSTDASDEERRGQLAEWIASPSNPLFARTMANRLWHYHFGRGLVETPNDLGFSGGHPSHPELLDWLSAELVRRNFSLKEMHRLIVTSATYRQQSRKRDEGMALDADNRLLWRMNPRRLDAESLRDSMLAVGGQLNEQIGGPSFHDFRPFNRAGTQFYEPEDRPGWEFQRRSIYRMWARGGKNPLLDTFDCPDPSTTSPKRGTTTTPLQALSLLNNAFTLRMAEGLADRLEAERPGAAKAQVERAFELACGRQPSDTEMGASVALVEKHGLFAFCRVLLNSNAFLYVD